MNGSRLHGWGDAALVACALLAFAMPWLVETFTLVGINVFVILSVLALSMSLVWGIGGVLSFGQSVFFGLGAYAYAVAAGNFGGSTIALGAAIVVPSASAALLGYFLFYGRISDVYLAVITLTVSLILYHLINTLAGADFRIGDVTLGGYNGMPGVAPIHVPWDATRALSYEAMYLLSVVVLVLVYVGLRRLVRTDFGRIVAAVRENELRAELLGYDARRYKLALFVIGAAIAGIAGALYAAWGSFVGPDVFGMSFAAQIIIWAQIGGVDTLAGPVVGCILIQALTTWLGTSHVTDANLVLGALLMFFVLVMPSGLLPRLAALIAATPIESRAGSRDESRADARSLR